MTYSGAHRICMDHMPVDRCCCSWLHRCGLDVWHAPYLKVTIISLYRFPAEARAKAEAEAKVHSFGGGLCLQCYYQDVHGCLRPTPGMKYFETHARSTHA